MEILNYKQVNKGFLLARFDVRIPEWKATFRNCSLFQKGDAQWVAMPNQSYKNEEGATKYYPLIEFDKAAKERFEKAVLQKIGAGEFTLAASTGEENAKINFETK